jgi:hypothetical protein
VGTYSGNPTESIPLWFNGETVLVFAPEKIEINTGKTASATSINNCIAFRMSVLYF